MPEESADKNNPSIGNFSLELLKTVIIVTVLAFVIRTFILQPFIVDGSSMRPEFQTNDYLLVDKLSYNFRQPNRGDIVVFKYPGNISIDYVKRIIGLPGETVRIANGHVYILNKAHPKGFELNEPYLNHADPTNLFNTSSPTDFVVPQNSFFVLGDNRPASSDSREWGYLPDKDMIGHVIIRAYPLLDFSIIPTPKY